MPFVTTASPRAGLRVSWIAALYLIIGGIVAATHDYWENLDGLKPIASALIATVLWPLLLVGIDLHVH